MEWAEGQSDRCVDIIHLNHKSHHPKKFYSVNREYSSGSKRNFEQNHRSRCTNAKLIYSGSDRNTNPVLVTPIRSRFNESFPVPFLVVFKQLQRWGNLNFLSSIAHRLFFDWNRLVSLSEQAYLSKGIGFFLHRDREPFSEEPLLVDPDPYPSSVDLEYSPGLESWNGLFLLGFAHCRRRGSR
uniref:Uncharacterized protein n=1 Tax=Setaria italica TaxID=4555 RepID=K3ZK06_SETIT